ncbi:unnamed protein product [Cuscuta europaea]|uniref:RING-type domain-containing protein n=1 Tax=Cuscuta europaea TaxID=41803 RepID=A0A9P0ZWF5_CUSEU|nr:unnamed protein product [Cuscuta europaea]
MSATAENASRKRKMKEVAEQPPPLPPPPRFTYSPATQLQLFPPHQAEASSSANPVPSHFDTALRLSSSIPARQQGRDEDLQWLYKPVKSCTTLLLTGDGNKEMDGLHHSPLLLPGGDGKKKVEEELHHNLQKHYPMIQNAVKSYSDRVREIIEEMSMRHLEVITIAEERAKKNMKETHDKMMARELEKTNLLEKVLAGYRDHFMKLGQKLTTLDHTNDSLRAVLHQTALRGGGNGRSLTVPHAAMLEEDAQSSSVDPEQSDPAVIITCRVCGRRTATVLLWPCRHLCLCKRCKAFTNRCPVCETVFEVDVEIDFSG